MEYLSKKRHSSIFAFEIRNKLHAAAHSVGDVDKKLSHEDSIFHNKVEITWYCLG